MAADATTEMLDKIISVLEEMGTKKVNSICVITLSTPSSYDHVLAKKVTNEQCFDTLRGIQTNQKTVSEEILALVSTVSRIIMEGGMSVRVEVLIKIIRDIHGQYEDMHKLFGVIGKVPDVKMIFLGDYVNRGPQSIETIIYLLCLKVKFRDRIYSLRRNHETLTVNRIYGCWNECALKSNVNLWRNFQSFYNRMPMAGLISKRVLCMHGGLSPHLTNLEQICQIKHPCEPSDRGLLIDLIWSDPTNKANGWSNSAGDLSYSFGTGVLLSACKLLKIDLIIKPHQVVQDGYELMVGEKLITIFSAPNYAGQFNNVGAIVCVDGSLQSEGSEEVKTAKLKVEKVRRRETNNKKENSRKEEEEKEKRENVTKDVGEKNEERTRRKRILLKIRRVLVRLANKTCSRNLPDFPSSPYRYVILEVYYTLS
ncbi:unnamed protein product [Onchocerca flexuosa]|uniref:SER_THR_PHOSPHATASE domain-containing protein n=1 Tax=Onchocerca flexuosa TaxID=387005 RepID=A0A183GZU9_9BILA|nr:unnamed protein product [Onchocerca flexuosa]